MNICFLSFQVMVPYEGGIQRVTTTLSHELSLRGYNICFLTYSESRKNEIGNPAIEFPQYYLDITSHNNTLIQETLDVFIREHKIEVVINQTPEKDSSLVIKLLPHFVKVLSVYHVVPFANYNVTRKRLLREFPHNTIRMALYKVLATIVPRLYSIHTIRKEKIIIETALQYSDKFIFISERYFSRIRHFIPAFPPEKLIAINNPNTFEVPTNIDFEAKRNVVLWVGRLDPNKNCIDFVKAWKVFSKTHPNWIAKVAGDGVSRKDCMRYTRKNAINNIEFLGYYQDVYSLYRESKVIVFTSFREAWGMSLTEAMSMGCAPCVYNTYETLADIVQDGVSGVLSEPNPMALASKLDKMVSNDINLRLMAEAANRQVSRFSATVICDKWEMLLK